MPPSFTPFINTLRYTPYLSFSPIRFLFSSATSPPPNQPSVQRYLLRTPFSGAARECPTPIILVRAIGLENIYPSLKEGVNKTNGDNDTHWEEWGGMFSEKGYTSLEVDIAAPLEPDLSQASTTGTNTILPPSPLKQMSSLLASQIRLLAIPFPPILISSGNTCLLTQMYIEDNPASGLVLINPPKDVEISQEQKGESLPVFGYEPRFPILVMGSPGGQSEQVKQSRLGKEAEKGRSRGGKGVKVEEAVDGARGAKSQILVERWMDSCGF